MKSIQIREYLLLLFLLILSISCSNSKKKIRDVLLDGNCFWDIYDPSDSFKVQSGFRIKPDGSCFLLTYRFRNLVRTDSVVEHYAHDIVTANRWFYSDSLLYLCDRYYEISDYNSDTVFLKTHRYNYYIVKNCITKSNFKKW